MKEKLNLKKRFILITVAGVMVILFAEYLGVFAGIDQFAYDNSFRLRGNRESSSSIIIAAIDEKTLEAYGQWPLERKHYAVLLDKLENAKAVGIDIIMPDSTDDDIMLQQAVKKHGRVVMAEYIQNGPGTIYSSERFTPYKSGHVHIEEGIDHTVRMIFHTLYYSGNRLSSFSSALYETISVHP